MMSMTWNWNGARWWKFDFHTHTPKSDDYGKGPNQTELKARSARDWVLDYMRAGLDCVAVTDHNSGEWIDELKNAEIALANESPADYRKLYIFPGVELSVNGGFHVLAILDPTKGSNDIERLIGACGYSGTRGKCDAVTDKTFIDVAAELVRIGGIVIPAHVDKAEDGLFKLTGQTLQQALSCEHLFAMEVADKDFVKPGAYSNAKVSWTEVLGSDAHHPSGKTGQQYPGSRFTWVKMGSPGIEGLRLALLDGALSVLRSDRVSENPNDHSERVIESIEISQARYMGRSNAYKMSLNPWMNAIIGGRGTGKSTLVEFLRMALRREDELPKGLQNDFEKYKTVYQDRDESGLLTPATEIRIIYRKDGTAYQVQWSPTGSLDPIQQKITERWEKAEGDIQQRFPVRIYSQKQIFQLASTPLALLKIINDAPEIDYTTWKKRLDIEENQYLSLRAKIREIKPESSEESRLKGELEDVKRKLTIFEQSGHAETFKMFQQSRRQAQAVETWEAQWSNTNSRLYEMAEDISLDALDETPFDKSNAADVLLIESAQQGCEAIGKISTQIKALAKETDNVLSEWREKKKISKWKTAVDQATFAYEALQKRLTQEGVADPLEYGMLVQRRQIIETKLKELEARKGQIGTLETQSNAILEHIARLRRKITQARKDFLSKLLHDNRYIRISTLPYGAKETVEAEFRRLIQRDSDSFERDIGSPDGEGLLGDIYKDQDDFVAEKIEKQLANLKQSLREMASHPEQAQVSDRRFAMHVAKLPPETLDRLDIWYPEDSLNVEYSTSTDRQIFRPIHEGSPGQKTAALLAFLLSYGEEPLILDQPEDDLDNRLIYDLIVTQLREIKRYRQVIVVTHNANIVVNGDAEYVVTLTAHRGQTQIEADGCLQEKAVRETICDIMEGGEKAFEQRYRRIAWEGRHVR
jgi:energy-coupling factor transporter ATP-binding protein EcfA2